MVKKSDLSLSQGNFEELKKLEAKKKIKRNWLIAASVVFSGLFVLVVKLFPEESLSNVFQGIYFAFGWILVSFISETQRELRLVRREMGMTRC